jgi:hypothetical protein
LERGALARSVLAHDTKGLAALHFEGEILQGLEIAMALEAVEGQQFPQPVARRFVDRVALGNSLKLNGVHGRKEEPV